MERESVPERHVIFAVLWAVAMLMHTSVFGQLLLYPAVPLAALWLLFRPQSAARLVVLAAAQVHAALDESPGFPNHWLLTLGMNASVLIAYAQLAIRQRSARVDFRELFDTFTPVMRVLVLILYFWATFAKLNAGYFDPATSCATVELHTLFPNWPAFAQSPLIQWGGIIGSVLTEAAIPLMLWVPALRVPGLLLAGSFHMLLSFDYYHAFVSILLAQFFLFTPASFPAEGLTDRRGPWSALPRLNEVWRRRLPALGRATACTAFVVLAGLAIAGRVDTYIATQRALFFLWAPPVFATFLLLQCVPWRSSPGVGSALRIRSWALAVIPFAIFLNGTAPYLGLKTEGSFAMFSNLRTEGGVSNHFVVRQPLSLGGYDDLVTLVESPFPRMQQRQQEGARFTFFELRSVASEPKRRDARLVYRRAGELHDVPRIGDDPEVGQPWPYWVRKIVRFRAPEAPFGSCQH